MNIVLLVLAVLSVGAVAIAAYVFMVAARNYVSDVPDEGQRLEDDETYNLEYVQRSAEDRRKISNVIDFPITLSSGEVVFRDRRLSERRSAS